jgi:hypothetical protein
MQHKNHSGMAHTRFNALETLANREMALQFTLLTQTAQRAKWFRKVLMESVWSVFCATKIGGMTDAEEK